MRIENQESKSENENLESFFTIAVDESAYWDSDVLAGAGIVAAFGLYLVRAGEETYCCELSPSSWCEWVENAFVFGDAETAAEWLDPHGLSFENGGEAGQYRKLIDPAKMDSRFIGDVFEIDPADLDADPGDRDEWHRELWAAARDEWHRAPDHPAITWESVFEAWQAEQAAARRAENRPVCDWPRGDVLPLFGAAWGLAQKTIGAAEGWGVDLAGRRLEKAWLARQGWARE